MPKLPATTSKKFIKILKKKGFVLDRIKGSHQMYYNYKTKRRAIVPKHNKDLGKGLLHQLLKDADISPDNL